ncbi:MAG TPA: DNA polymerase I [Candidatus Cloacimonadota bacterium]|nr:DNA polymerase I [Candidatus Cloacimonadota bacterium]HOH59650.1 DNA polymerase I [Candidatus Cloacimonadota bacterium]
MKPKLYLIDGTALLYRAYFAFIRNPLINSRNENTSAIYGVVNSFLTLVDKMQAEYIAIAFDRKAPTFRHQDYSEYKANRPPMPEDMQYQIAPIIDFFRSCKVPQIGKDGYEADDALGTMGERFKREYQIVYVTSDKDYCQLLDDGVLLYDPMKDITLDKDGVFARYQVRAEQFVDYLALVGDSSDNIPGVKGIGPKAAEALLHDYPDLEAIYADLENVNPKYRGKLAENRDNAFLSKHLATIVRYADLELPQIHELKFQIANLRDALKILKDYELISLIRRIEARYPELRDKVPLPVEEEVQEDIFNSSPKPEMIKAEIPEDHMVTKDFQPILIDQTSLPGLLEELRQQEQIAIDCETDSLDPISASLVGISLCFDPERAYYLPLGHRMAENLPLYETLDELRNALSGKVLIGHNLKYDLTVFTQHKLYLDNPIFDTMIAAYILDAGIYNFSLDDCAARELNYKMMPITELIGKGKNQISFDLVSADDACFYAAEDAWAAFRLHQVYRPLIEYSMAKSVYYDIEIPLIRVLGRMETNGVSLDSRMLGEISHHLNLELKRLTEEIYALAGYEFNINSTQQLAKLLFDEMRLPAKKKTKSGYSTDNSVLEALAEDYDFVQKLIDYRQLMKLESTYVSALPKLINPVSGRIHSSFNQCVASTGRLSSTNPNLQNIPIRSKIGREIRKAFIAGEEDSVIMAADYSQIELRLLALMSGDESLQKAFRDGIDIHRQTAALIHNVPLDEVNSDMRRAAKTINFGLLYGMGQRKLARELGIGLAEAKALIDNYFARFPAIRRYTAESVDKARATLHAYTLFGRFLALPGIDSKNKGISSEAERVAVNMPIQGTAADIIKRAMIAIHELIKDNSEIKMILQVHDELVFEVKKNYLEEAAALVRREMEHALPRQYRDRVSLCVDIGSGKSWFDAH